jgi:DEAD/DEAH box helicase domain-containing protein
LFECPNCEEFEKFLQVKKGFCRTITIRTYYDKTITRKLSAWSSLKYEKEDGIYCLKCDSLLAVSPKRLEFLQLNDEPPVKVKYEQIKVAPKIQKLIKTFPDTQVDIHWAPQRPQKAKYAKLDGKKLGIPPKLLEAIEKAHGINDECYYSHQVEAIKLAMQGKNVVIQTPTSSGKTHCYLIPVFSELINNHDSTALFIFPTKALSYDQIIKLTDLSEDNSPNELNPERNLFNVTIDGRKIVCAKYDRDVQAEMDKRNIRSKARVIITNPDALHFKMLPHLKTKAGSFEDFFKNLRYVVLDEIHSYRGAFGANVALLMRRLRLLCFRLGNTKLQFVCCSATVPNPLNQAETIVGLPFETIMNDGAPSHPKAFLLWNPALLKDELTRREPTTDAIDVLTKVVLTKNDPLRTLTFIQSLNGVQHFDQLLRRAFTRTGSTYKDRVATFSSRSKPEDRIEIQNKMISGEIVHVSATSALELGIDIGDLSCCMMLGYPGTISSTLQEAGRVGRKGESLVIIMLRNDPFEQYFARDPKVFWEAFQRTETPKVPIENKNLLTSQLLCALWEGKQVGGYSESDFESYFGPSVKEILETLRDKGKEVYSEIRRGQAYWSFSKSAPEKGDIYKNIRIPISKGKFDVIDRNNKNKVGECDSHLVPRDLFTDAIWINNGEFYRSIEIKTKESAVYVERIQNDDTYTFAMPKRQIKLEGKDLGSRKYPGFSAHYGDIDLKSEVRLYREVKFGKGKGGMGKDELGDVKTTWAPKMEYITSALRIVFSEDFVQEFLIKVGKESRDDFVVALHGLEHSTHAMVPIISDFDPHDVSSEYLLSDSNNDGKPALYLFDTFSGGLGLAEYCFNHIHEILQKARDLVSTCNCEDGCPNCLITPWCNEQNQSINKSDTLALLDLMLERVKHERSKTKRKNVRKVT